MIAPFVLDETGWHEETGRRYQFRLAELVKEDSTLGESYRRKFLGLPEEHPGLLRSLTQAQQCKHLGKLLDRTKCGTETLACAVHGTCSQQPGKNGKMALCQDCQHFQPKQEMVSAATWPQLNTTPKRKYAVVTCAVNQPGREMLKVTHDNLKGYADKIGADFHVIEGEHDQFALIEKMRAGQYLDYYDRLIFLDVDIVLAQDCPNLFDVVPEDAIAMHDDYYSLDLQEHWLDAEYKALQESQGMECLKIPLCLNSGVIVCSKQHKAMYDPPTKPFPKSHCSEQSLININMQRSKLKWMPLKRAYNWQWWIHRDRPGTDLDSVKVWHAAGYGMDGKGNAAPYPQRIDWLKRRLREQREGLPVLSLDDPVFDNEFLPPLEVPGSEWMTYAEMQLVRKYAEGKDYLEIGTYAGFSACIASAVASMVTCIDRFDPGNFGFAIEQVRKHVDQFRKCQVNYIAGEADEIAAGLTGQHDCILIDGGHHYEDVRDNIKSVLPLLAPGGVLLFHDVSSTFPGVQRAIEEYPGWELLEKSHSLAVYSPSGTVSRPITTSREVVKWSNFSPSAPVPTILPFFDSLPDGLAKPPKAAVGFQNWVNVQQAFAQAWPQWLSQVPPMPDFRRLMYEEQGVVMIGGGKTYEIGLYVGCRMLRHAGYTGPIMLWHRGELEPINHKLFYPLNVTIIDAIAYREQSERTKCRRWGSGNWNDTDNRWGGWGLKSYAVLHSPFKVVFYHDADWYLTGQGDMLEQCFSLAREHGSVIWGDTNDGGNDANVKWHLHGLTGDNAMGFQGGQWVVDKSDPSVWAGLNMYRKLDDYSDYYYRVHYGDQDNMRLAWAMAGSRRYYFDRRCIPIDGGMVAPFVHRQVGVHRIHDKQFRRVIRRLPRESTAQQFAEEYRATSR